MEHNLIEDFLADVEFAYEKALDLSSTVIAGQTDPHATGMVCNSRLQSFIQNSNASPPMASADTQTSIKPKSCSSNSDVPGSSDAFGFQNNYESFLRGLVSPSNEEPRDAHKNPPLFPEPKPFSQTGKSSFTRGSKDECSQRMKVDGPANPVSGIVFSKNLHGIKPPVSFACIKGNASPNLSPYVKRMKKGFFVVRKLAAGAPKKGRSGLKKKGLRNRPKLAKIVQSLKKRRRRRKDPAQKVYVTFTDKDVLMGRGGRSNNHPGNREYRQHILPLQSVYQRLSTRDKTQMSIGVIAWVKARGGRFVQQDGPVKGQGYIVTDATAHDKVCQALREDHTEEGRLAKKSRTKAGKK